MPSGFEIFRYYKASTFFLLNKLLWRTKSLDVERVERICIRQSTVFPNNPGQINPKIDMTYSKSNTFQNTVFQLYIHRSLNVPSMKSVQNWSFSGPYFPAFKLNMVIYSVNLHIHFGRVEMMSDTEEYVTQCVT